MHYNKYPQTVRNEANRMFKAGHSFTEISEWLMSKGYQGRNGRLSTTSVQSMMGRRKDKTATKPKPKTIIRRAVTVDQQTAPVQTPTVQETTPVVQQEELAVGQSPAPQMSSFRFDREFYTDLILKSDYLGAQKQIEEIKAIRGLV